MKKRILSIALMLGTILTLLTVSALAADTTPSKPAVGTGSSDSPYQISSAAELYWFAGLVNGTLTDGTAQNTTACAALISNITVNSQVLEGGSLVSDTSSLIRWTPIGGNTDASGYASGPKYSGVFDGGNHTISGLYFDDEGKQYVGLFGYCEGAIIKDLKLADSYIHGSQRVGGICGTSYLNSSISGCTNGAAVSASPYTANAYVGGICGENNRASIEKCGNTGAASANTSIESYCGGICGYNSGYTDIKSTISNCWNAGAASAAKGGGGICGRNHEYASITSCFNYGAVSNNTDCGAAVGVNGSSNTTLSNCYFDTNTSVSNGIGYDYSGSGSVSGKTTAEFSSGEVCYRMNNGVSDGTQAWYQYIDTGTLDTYPQFSGGRVIQSGYRYTNDNLTVVRVSFKDYAPGKTWDGATLANPTEAQLTLENTSYGNVTFTWYKNSVDEANKLSSAPSGAGTYYVVASVAETETTSAAITVSTAIIISQSTATIELSGSSFSYTGSAIEPAVTVQDSSTGAVVDTNEYTVSYSNNTNAGTATVTISDVAGGNYTINATMNFTITKLTPSLTVFPTPENSTSLGSSVSLIISIGCAAPIPPGTITIKDGETTIASNIAITSFDVSYTWTNPSGGTHSITAVYTPSADSTGSNYNGSTSQALSYKIIKPAQAALSITGQPASVTYLDSFTLGTSGGTGDGAVTWVVTDGGSYAAVAPAAGAVSITGVGSVTITATKAGGDNYEDATATYTFAAAKAEPNVGMVSYGSTDLIYPATALTTVNGKLTKSGAAAGTLALADGMIFTVGTNDYTWVFTPSDSANYQTAIGTISLTVTADTLSSIEAAGTPGKTAYNYGDTFDKTGLTIIANYVSGNTGVVTNLVTSASLAVGQTSVTLSYTEGGVTKTCTVSGITVNKATAAITGVSVPNRVYNGSTIAPTGAAICKVGDTDVTNGCGTLVYTYTGTGSTSYADSSISPTNAGTYKLVVSLADGNANYTGASDAINFTIVPKQLAITGLTATNRAYDGTSAVTLTGGILDGKVGSDDVTATIPVSGTINGAGIGTGKTVTVTKPELSGSTAANYTLADISGVTVDIAPAQIIITGDGTVAVTKPYDGTTAAGILNGALTFSGKIGSEDVSVTATPGTYAADAVDAGTGKTVTLTLALNGTAAGNYALASSSCAFTGAAITKGTYGTAVSANVSAMVHKTSTGTVTPSVFTLPAGFKNAAIVSVTETEDTDSILTISGTAYTIVPTAVPQSAACTVVISSDNYENVTATLTFPATNQEEAAITASIASKTYDGKTVSVTPTSATPGLTYSYQWQKNTGSPDTPSWETLAPNTAPKDAGSYQVMITGQSDTHMGIKTVTFTIAKATVVAVADNKSMTTGGTLPTFTVSYTGIVSGDTADSIFTTKATASCTADGKTAGSYTIAATTPSLTTAAASNYTLGASVNGTLTVSTPSYNGGSSSGSNRDTVRISSGTDQISASVSISGGTATISVTDAQAKAVASDAKTAGTVKLDVSEKKTDSVVAPSKLIFAADGAALEVALSTGTVTLDEAALASVKGKGDIKLSVETVSHSALTDRQKEVLGNQAETALMVDVTLYAGGNRTSTFGNGKITVSVPYTPKSGENADNITVWFLKDDGTIEPKSGFYANGKVTFTTEHLSQYLIVNFPFADVTETAWYYSGVAYAYNNGLFAGTSATAFSPDTAMTRQMIWMVLARMDGKAPADLEAARTWAMKNGISDGTNPTNSLTREQMATILYRYAQYKGYDTTQGGMAIREFADYDSIPEYALTAMDWSVNAGLIQGSDNHLMPTDTATRAQAATILQHFFQNVVK
ncbi:MAG: YDG domain-containing protein [Pseudoflavonifractor sp.]|nr:YDG domain-containing protein [Pseudoflavonifractor sp.]